MTEDANYPTGKMAGIAEDRDELERALASLARHGVDDAHLEVLHGPEDADQISVEPSGEHSFTENVVRIVQHVLGGETEAIKQLSDALDRGAFIVLVDLEAEDSDEEVLDARKREIARALADAGIESIDYYGEWQVEDFSHLS